MPRWYHRHHYTAPAASAGGDSLLVARAPSISPCLKFVHLLFWFDVLAFELESTWEPMHDDLLFALLQ